MFANTKLTFFYSLSDAQLGETCVRGRTGECSDATKTECSTTNICICNSAYFDSSGFEVGGTCIDSKCFFALKFAMKKSTY